MAGYIWHIIHAYETYMALSEETRAKMPKDALNCMMLGAVVPDLAKREFKTKTHFNIPHPVYGDSYIIPDIKKVEELFLKKDPTRLGVLSHLRYDLDHIENFLLVYGKPTEDGMFINTKTGEKMTGLMFFGNWDDVYGQLYQLYDRFNAEMAEEYTSDIAAAFGRNETAGKEGFLRLVMWLFGEHVKLSGIEEMDKYRGTDELYATIEGFFNNNGKGCIINAKTDDLVDIVKSSAANLAKQIDELYAA